jgi:hypothetical protein
LVDTEDKRTFPLQFLLRSLRFRVAVRNLGQGFPCVFSATQSLRKGLFKFFTALWVSVSQSPNYFAC